MGPQGLDAALIFGLGSALGTATRSHGNLRFLLDWDADAAPSAMVLTPSGLSALVVGNIFATMLASEQQLAPFIRFGNGAAFAAAILKSLPEGAARIGIAGQDEMPLAIWAGLADAGAERWVDCGPELARRRSVKDATQIAYHREAARISDMLFEHLGPLLCNGLPGFRIQAELERLARDRGCEVCRTWLTVSAMLGRCRFMRDENRAVPQEGDQVLLGTMLMLHGHWGHAIRTGTLGRPTPRAKDIFVRVEAMHAAMLSRLQPGNDLRGVGKAGIVTPAPGVFQFRSGHAIGHSYEDPIGTAEFPQPYDVLSPSSDALPIEPGMIFELHPNLFVERAGAASIGDMVLVTASGPELLTQFPRGLAAF